MKPALDQDSLLLLQAALDGELDAAAQLAMERRLAAEPDLAAEYARQVALRNAIRAKLTPAVAPDTLRRRVAALGEPPSRQKSFPLPARPSWIGLAAAVVVAAGLGSAGTSILRVNGPPPLAETLVADHMRSLLAAAPVDVANSDQHVVKPWFDTHLAVSPQVLDLSAQGFSLVGGRVEVVAGVPVPALVYRLRSHLISVTAVPATIGATVAGKASFKGFGVISWRSPDFVYWAVSDISAVDLEAFATAFKAATGPRM